MKTIILFSAFLYAVLTGGIFLSKSHERVHGSDLLQVFEPEDSTRYVFVGAEACATKCHNNEEMGFQYDLWRKSAHSGAFADLSSDHAREYALRSGISGEPSASLKCLRCHSTGPEAAVESLASTYKREDGVTCESCHKGEFTPKTYLPVESDCLKCHNGSVHEVPPFAFEEKCRIIAHPRPKKKQE